jgi:hypothetical protein
MTRVPALCVAPDPGPRQSGTSSDSPATALTRHPIPRCFGPRTDRLYAKDRQVDGEAGLRLTGTSRGARTSASAWRSIGSPRESLTLAPVRSALEGRGHCISQLKVSVYHCFGVAEK